MFAAPEVIGAAYAEIMTPLVEAARTGSCSRAASPTSIPPRMPCRFRACCGPASKGNGQQAIAIAPTCAGPRPAVLSPRPRRRPDVHRGGSRTRAPPTSPRRGTTDSRRSMDLGLSGSAAVVTGGSKGMGLAIAETLAAEGARVAVMARGQAALDSAVESLLAAGAPDAVGISVDMTDADSIAAGFAAVAERWGELNSLVHTIGPGDGYFEEMNDAQWDAAFALGTMSGVRSIRAALPMLRSAEWARIVTLSRALDPAAEPAHRRLHGVEGGVEQRHQEPVEKPCQGRHSGQLRVSGHDRHGELHREPQGHPGRRRSGRDQSGRRDDVDRRQLPSAVRPRPRRTARGDRLHHRRIWRRGATATSPVPPSTSTVARTSSAR